MLRSTRLDEIVDYLEHAGNGSPVMVVPLMLSEAVKRTLQRIEHGGRPAIRYNGVLFTDPALFQAVRERPDFPP